MPKPPCVKNGVHCAKRHPGCQDKCPDMVPFHAQCEAIRKARAEEDIYLSYVVPIIIKRREK